MNGYPYMGNGGFQPLLMNGGMSRGLASMGGGVDSAGLSDQDRHDIAVNVALNKALAPIWQENQPSLWGPFVQGIGSGAFGALASILTENMKSNREKELLEMQQKYRKLAPEQQLGVARLMGSFNQPAPGPVTMESPAMVAQAMDPTQRLAALQQRLAAARGQ